MKRRTPWIPNHTAWVFLAGVASTWLMQSDTAAATRENDARAAGPNSTPAVASSVIHPQRAAVATFSEQHPRTRFSKAGSRITQVYGQAFGSGDSPEQAAEQFRLQHAGMFGVPAADLRPVSILEDQRHTQQVMFDRQTGEYKFTLVYYSQHVNSIPVFRADLRLLVRNEANYPLVLASANLRNLGGFPAPLNGVNLKDTPLWEGAARELVPALRNFTQPQAVIWAGVNDMIVAPTLAVTFVGDNEGAPPTDPIEKWLFVVDATTAEILYQEDLVLETDVFGHVGGVASDGPGADFCADEIFKDMSYARVNIGGTNAFADVLGDYVIPNAGDSQVTVQSPIRGQYFVVENFNLPNTVLSTNVIPPGPADFTHNAPNSSEFVRAEVNAYIEANFVRDLILEANPTYPTISTQTEYTVSVNRTGGICPGNAQYTGDAINFCRAGSGFPNTAWSSVVYHEYGHHLVEMGGSGQGQYGEGMGDVMSVVALDDHRLGLGFFGDCVSWLRDADNNLQYPCSGGFHDCGQLISGCVWSTRNALIVTEPVDYLDILMSLSVNSVLVHSGDLITPQITIDWLTLDDDDADIGNGTPHYNEIAAGFGAHNMPAPPLQLISFIYPDGLPDLLVPKHSTLIRVNVVPLTGTPIAGTGAVSYRIGNCGPFTTVVMAETSPNEYEAILPAVGCPEVIHYFFSADTVEMGTLNDPLDAPADTFGAVAAVGSTGPPLFEDDFETDQSWTVTNSGGLDDGAWTRGIPVDCDRGDPPSDSDGSGQCYLTDNSSGDACNSDVDDGTTTLTSPVMDASQAGTTISYDRWYSNTEGSNPMQDIFVVEVSDDGGASWVNLETVGPNGPEVDGGWIHKEFSLDEVPCFEPSDQFRIRFIASDTDPQSVVEAGVDAVQLVTLVCEGLCSADLSGDGDVDAEDLAMLLGSWGPNPGHPADLNGDDQVGAADLAILLGSWGPCT